MMNRKMNGFFVRLIGVIYMRLWEFGVHSLHVQHVTTNKRVRLLISASQRRLVRTLLLESFRSFVFSVFEKVP
jgi:hypothetical protein